VQELRRASSSSFTNFSGYLSKTRRRAEKNPFPPLLHFSSLDHQRPPPGMDSETSSTLSFPSPTNFDHPAADPCRFVNRPVQPELLEPPVR
jgi:hypothetical protein